MVLDADSSFLMSRDRRRGIHAVQRGAEKGDAPDFQARLAALTRKKPELSADLQRRLAENPNLLENSVLQYDDPFGPACPPEDWEANS